MRRNLYLIDDFYVEWAKNPKQFEPDHRTVISKLSEELEKFNVTDDLMIKNFDGEGIGNHRVGNYIESLNIIDDDFDVVEVTESCNYPCIIIQEDDHDKVNRLSTESNRMAIIHDKYMGDGKYNKEED